MTAMRRIQTEYEEAEAAAMVSLFGKMGGRRETTADARCESYKVLKPRVEETRPGRVSARVPFPVELSLIRVITEKDCCRG